MTTAELVQQLHRDLEALQQHITQAGRLAADINREHRPRVEVEPGMRFGQPHIRGVPVEAVAGMVWAGESVETVADEFGQWAEQVDDELWRSRFQVPDPPCRGDTP